MSPIYIRVTTAHGKEGKQGQGKGKHRGNSGTGKTQGI